MLTESVAGVIDVLPALACQGDDWIPADVDQSVKAAIAKLNLAKGQRISFLFNIPKRDDRTQSRIRSVCKQWASESGLEFWQFTY
jgi:hypothetical protein